MKRLIFSYNICGNTFRVADGSTAVQSRCRRTSRTVNVRTVLQSLVVALFHDPEYEGNGCPERKVSERVS
jgi:hypothetical protein